MPKTSSKYIKITQDFFYISFNFFFLIFNPYFLAFIFLFFFMLESTKTQLPMRKQQIITVIVIIFIINSIIIASVLINIPSLLTLLRLSLSPSIHHYLPIFVSLFPVFSHSSVHLVSCLHVIFFCFSLFFFP